MRDELSAEELAGRSAFAKQGFMNSVKRIAGVDDDQAARVLQIYLELEIARIDVEQTIVVVEHRHFMAPDALRRAAGLSD